MTKADGEAKVLGKLLVVDDNEMNRDMLSRRLSRRGHTVDVAEDGHRALERIGAEPYDLILLDIMMPGIDGLEVLETLRREYAQGDLPVIMATAKDESDSVVKALKLGANDYVTKPLDFPVVQARVQTQLTLKRSRDALREAHARMKEDLDAAAKVQRDLLPTQPPEVAGVRFAWRYEPCDELAGDILNIIPIDEHRVAAYVLDVCGHGVRSALLSVAITHTLSRTRDRSSIITQPAVDGAGQDIVPPSVVAHRLSALFPMEANGMLFSTLGYGVLDTRSRTFTFACAGHPGPLVVRADGSTEQLESSSAPIGVYMDDEPDPSEYNDDSVQLGPGDRLYLYSDGLVEEQNRQREEFGLSRLTEALAENRTGALDAGIEVAVVRLREWIEGAAFRDDLSIVALELE